jgi:DNA polymerase-1
VTGTKLINKFLEGTPALVALRNKVKKFAEKGSLPGLDGRRLYVRSPHKALNTLLQGGGAAVMKVALVVFDQELRSLGIPYRFLLNVHDEVQVETPTQYAEQVAKLGVEAIKQAGVVLKLRCPLDGEAKIGANWRDTH